MSEGAEQSQRYCQNCGAAIRPGTSFCVSCGTPLNQGTGEQGPNNTVHPPPTPSRSLADTLRETLLGWSRRFSEARSGSGGTTLNQLPNKIINWFKDLPSTPKLILVGLVLLLLLVLLSPLAFVVAALLFGASIIALIIRMTRRESVKGWATVAVISIALMFVFGSLTSSIYGNSSSGNNKVPGSQGDNAVPQGDKKQALIGTWRTSRNGDVDVLTLNPDGTVESQNPGAPVLVGTYKADVTKTPATLVMDFNPDNNRVDAELLVEFIDNDHLRVTMGSGARQSDRSDFGTLTYTRIK